VRRVHVYAQVISTAAWTALARLTSRLRHVLLMGRLLIYFHGLGLTLRAFLRLIRCFRIESRLIPRWSELESNRFHDFDVFPTGRGDGEGVEVVIHLAVRGS
jgi:hypothetical protein